MRYIDASLHNIDKVAVNTQPERIWRSLTAGLLALSLLCGIRSAHGDEFTVQHTGADVAFSSGLTGSGVTVAVLDSGLPGMSGSDLGNRILRLVNCVSSATDGKDECGHGTHIVGILAGDGTCSTGVRFTRTFYGIARAANIISVRVLDKTGSGTVSDVISGIQFCIKFNQQPTTTAASRIRVMNISLGHAVGESYTTDPLCQAVEAAWKSGIVVVCSAGNNGRLNLAQTAGAPNEGWGTAYGSIQSPGNDPCVITVGAIKNIDGNRVNDRIATYSSRGPSRLDYVMKPDIVAPGNQVISLAFTASYLYNTYSASNMIPLSYYVRSGSETTVSTRYFRLSGTSMSAPVVSGAAVLMLQKYPNLTPDTIKARLMISADKWVQPNGPGDPCTFGAGYLNIPAALACTAVPKQAVTSPSMSQDANGNVFLDINSAIWGADRNGVRTIWGISGVNDLRAVWGTKAIWGSSANTLNAGNAIWGSSVWSDRAVWGTSSSAAVDLSSTAIQGE